MTKKSNRFEAPAPKIGIRPTIDGRLGGVRESLEVQTMNMAKAAADLLVSNLRHPDGSAVECVIADTTIGGVKEAQACAEKFAREGVGVSLTVTPCWCYGSETMDMDKSTPKAIWGFNGTERPGAVYLAAVLAAHNQKGIPAFSIYGQDVQDAEDTTVPEDVKQKLLNFTKSGLAVAWMKNKSYLSMGGTSMGIAGSIVSPDFLEKYLGMRVESVDMSEFIRRLNLDIYDKQEYEKAYKWVKENGKIGLDPNAEDVQHTKEHKEETLQTSIKMTLIARDLMVGNQKLADMGYAEEAQGHGAIAAGFQGQRHWTDFMPNGDFMEGMLNTSFDWNGTRQPYIMATENDYLNAVVMLFSHLLTGSAQVFADVRTYWSPDAVKRVTGHTLTGNGANGLIHLINSGSAALDGSGKQKIDGKPAIKSWWDVTDEDVKNTMDVTSFCYGDLGYFRGGGYSTLFKTEGGMPVTMSRINLIDGLGPVLQIAEGYTVSLPDDVHDVLDKRTNETWPTTWFAPIVSGDGAFKDVYSVMANWGANHGAFSYGHIGDQLITLASMLRIPVNMHNVSDDRIFRPTTWAAFGTKDLEGADYRCCDNFGPLYK
ncbi:MAG: L-fucose isomerase [Clostridiales bacterium]|nr:L-fucose isomerase [Clostridiales bacterium]